jgi:hypothetical protein
LSTDFFSQSDTMAKCLSTARPSGEPFVLSSLQEIEGVSARLARPLRDGVRTRVPLIRFFDGSDCIASR